MSAVQDLDKIDAIGFVSSTNSVVIKIFDHLNWDNPQEHLYTLQEKLNAYIRFIESGNIYEAYPKAKNKNLVVSIDFRYDLPTEAEEFLAQVNLIFIKSALTLEYKSGLG